MIHEEALEYKHVWRAAFWRKFAAQLCFAAAGGFLAVPIGAAIFAWANVPARPTPPPPPPCLAEGPATIKQMSYAGGRTRVLFKRGDGPLFVCLFDGAERYDLWEHLTIGKDVVTAKDGWQI